MALIRPFTQSDSQQVADLRWHAFGSGEGPAPSSIATYFRDIFLDSPWCDPDSPSLVIEDKGGAIVGFLGILTRPMLFQGQAIKVATSSQWMVVPKAGPMGLDLIRRLFGGPHDLLFADDANDKARTMWERFGGHTCHLLSLRWLRILRPAGFLASLASPGPASTVANDLLRGVGKGVDALLGQIAIGDVSDFRPTLTGEPLDATRLLECAGAYATAYRLRPSYEPRSLSWLLEQARRKTCFGTFKGVMLRDPDGHPAGWYGYYLHPGKTAQVLTLGICGARAGKVLDHLFWDAWREGAVAISGRMEPAYLSELSDKQCVFKREFGWTLMHARRPEILQAVDCGGAWLSRLDGEWWMRFPELGQTFFPSRRTSLKPAAAY